SPSLIVTTPNLTHVDRARELLVGWWGEDGVEGGDNGDGVEGGGLSDGGEPLLLFDRRSLESACTGTGWAVTRWAEVARLHAGGAAAGLDEALPEVMVAAIQAVAQTLNPDWAVDHLVVELAPAPAGDRGRGARVDTERHRTGSWADQRRSLEAFVASVGALTGESNRRAGPSLR
ncbi:MAG: hypothetical protein M0007_12755, partial [Actinomycetota bacterium]|nr:hypothetical protein [Actinomycetota bacterium]